MSSHHETKFKKFLSLKALKLTHDNFPGLITQTATAMEERGKKERKERIGVGRIGTQKGKRNYNNLFVA